MTAIPPQGSVLSPNWWLGILPPELWNAKKRGYQYEVDALPVLVSAAVQQFSTDVQQDSYFFCTELATLVTTHASPPALLWGSGFTNNAPSQLLIQVVDTATGNTLQNAPVPMDNIAGSGPFPETEYFPYLFPPAGKIQVNLTNLNNAQMDVRMTFKGIRIFA